MYSKYRALKVFKNVFNTQKTIQMQRTIESFEIPAIIALNPF